ncbi:MAG: hypothetical protein O2951_15285 [Bacteroidetes bacterium]|nr:hypothetical protein [Bacteroidota bacterium]
MDQVKGDIDRMSRFELVLIIKKLELAEVTKRAFQNRFYDVDKGSYGPFGGNIFALKIGVQPDQYPKVITALKSDIENNDGHLDTGIFGTQFFFEILSENGLHDLAFEAINKRTQPGYGYWLEQGTTTTREAWDDGGSHNHPMFGGGLVWFYRKLAGMSADPEQPGYRHIIFRPQPVDEVTFTKYYNNTIYGEAGIHWRKEGDEFTMNVKVPVGCTATVYIPAENEADVSEGEVLASKSTGIDFQRLDEGYAVFSVKSGEYRFVSNSD